MSKFRYLLCALIWTILPMPRLMAQVCQTGTTCVLTQHNDASRTGQNLQETTLNTANVNMTDFGAVLSIPVTGNIFAQPLYVSNLSVAGTPHNVLYVATSENYVYAFDADTGATLWSLGQNALGTPVPGQDICVTDRTECPYTDVIPDIGILATPVIDPVSETIYVVVNFKANGSYHFQLHALSLTSGAEKFGGPAEITATGLNQLTELARPGLLLANNMVYLAMGSVGDFPTWHGYVMAYDANTLQQVDVFNSTSQNNNVGGAGIWQSGNGLVADANGDVYAVTSNGNFDVNTGGKDYGSAYLKLSSTLSVLDYFVPYNQASLNPESDNVDLGSGGPLLIPNSTLLVGTGKDAVLRVVDTTNMGKYNPSSNQNVQNINSATNAPVLGSPVYWNSPSLGPLVYLWGLADVLKAWSFTGQELNPAPVSTGTISGAPSDVAALSISSDGNTSGTGILWATRPISPGVSNPGPTPGIIYAFDASDMTHELWDSQQNSSRDALGDWAKFNPPTVVNGKVYVPTFCAVSAPGCAGQLMVYGLIATPDFSVLVSPSSQSVNPGSSASYIVFVSPQAGFNGTVTLTCSGLPSGAACSPASVSVSPGATQQVSVPLTVTTGASTANNTYAFTITATSGNLTHSTGASLTVGAGSGSAPFTLTSTPLSPSTIMPGSSSTSQIAVAPVGSFNSSVNLSCAITPATSVPPTCSLSAATVSGAKGTVTLTVSTVASTALLNKSKRFPATFYAVLLPLCGLALAGTSRRRKQLMYGAMMLVALLAIVSMGACGGGSSSGGGGGGGTTAGSYTATVTGTSGASSQTTTLNVTVQ